MPSKKITKRVRPTAEARTAAREAAARVRLLPPGLLPLGIEDKPGATPWGPMRTKAWVRDFLNDFLIVGCAMKALDGIVVIWCVAWEDNGKWQVGKPSEPYAKAENIAYLEHKELSDAGSVRILDGNPPWAALLPQPLWVG